MIRTRSSTRGLPSPLVEAVTRHVGKWDIQDSGTDQVGKTDNVNHRMLVPLNDDDCACGMSHGNFVRGHELIHSKFSPDRPRPFKVKVGGLDELDVSAANVEIAEEFRVNMILEQTEGQRVLRSGWCPDLINTGIRGLMDRKEYQEIIRIALAGGPGYHRKVRSALLKYQKAAVRASRKGKSETALELRDKQIQIAEALADALVQYADQAGWIMDRSANWALRKVPPWSAVEELAAYLEVNFANLDEKTRGMGDTDDSDLGILDKMLNAMSTDLSPSGDVRKDGNKLEMDGGHGYGSGPMEWGKPDYTEANMPLSFPAWKRQRRNRAVEEGTTPRYMHRWATDKRIFHRTKRVGGGTILIDDSGSMGFDADDLEHIIEVAPAATVALYAGGDGKGEIRVVAKDGKRAKTDDLSIEDYGGNDIDGPALEWLGEQPYPRVWVTDGGVVSLSHGFSQYTVDVCKSLCIKHRITMVETAEEAAEAFRLGIMAR